MLAHLTRLFRPAPERLALHSAYERIVEQARQPVFYAEHGVPDTLDGRFELILLHLNLVLTRLKQEPGDTYTQQQGLIEIFLEDMDRSIRELGVGDTGVGRRVKKMANAFYGRMKAYEEAKEDATLWQEALRRNLYGTSEPTEGSVTAMTRYILTAKEALRRTPMETIVSGAPISFS